MNKDDQSDPQPREQPRGETGALTRREQETVGELRLLDPQLAGLYERGVLLARDIGQAGAAHLAAYIGRELSRGVLRRVLEDEGLSISGNDLQQVPKEERNRSTIAKALHLPPDDPRVDDWFRLPGLFASWEKYDNGPPPPGEVRSAFERLSTLLYGLVAPYYTTEAELDMLLQVEAPTAEDARRLRHLQLRPGQRNYFFGRLRNAAWVRLLSAEGFFRNPPGPRMNTDGSWSARPWPEGHYLVVAAPDAPAEVGAVLESIPSDNENPVVWNLVAQAATRLPPELAIRAVPILTKALTTAAARMFSDSVVDLVDALAAAGRSEAFDLADFLLYVVSESEVTDRESVRFSSRTDWIFPRLGWHDHGALLDRLIPTLEALDPERTLLILFAKIQRVQQLADKLDFSRWWRLHSTEINRRRDRDVVGMIISSAVGVAQRLGAKGREEAARVLGVVGGHSGEFFARLGYLVLAHAGHLLPEKIDRILRSKEAREPGLPATEIAELLRGQFRNASPDARKEYAEALEAGPDRETLRAALHGWYGRDATDDEIESHISHHQRRVLWFFRGDIPEEFRDLAARLEILGVTPSQREQQLAEVGSYSEAGFWGGDDASPLSDDELAERTVDEVVEFLREWNPGEETGSSFGLQASLSRYAVDNPGAASAVLSRATDAEIAPALVEGLVNGLREAVKADTDLEWPAVLNGARQVVRHVAVLDVDQSADLAQWRRTAGRAVLLIQEGCATDSIPPDLVSDVWEVLQDAAAAPPIWSVDHPARDSTVAAVFSGMLNDASGDVANAVISAALWDYRSRLPDSSELLEEAREFARRPVRRQLVPILDRWRQFGGPNGAIPRAVLGQYLPQLHLLVPEWIEARSTDLFARGMEDPASSPTWTAYISWARLYDTVFGALRPWYVKAAASAAAWASAAGDAGGMRELKQRYAEHLVVAVVRGLVSVGDDDALLETAYQNLSPSDWGHAYWTIFRGWSDSDEPVPADYVQRLIGMWEWRISELGKGPVSAAVDEAKQLSWLFHTPHVPDAEVIRLGQATAQLAHGQLEMYSRWDRMMALSQADPDGTFMIVDAVLLAALRAEYVFVPVDDVRPILAHLLKAGSPETQQRVRRLVNKLGERGFRQLKDLVDGSG